MMKHTIPAALVAAMLISALPACAKKQPEKPSELAEVRLPVTETQPASEPPAASPPARPAQIQPVAIESVRGLDPEKAEEAVLSAFRTKAGPEAEKLAALKERAAIGDDAAKEEFVEIVFKRPHTDIEYRNAIRYLTTIREFNDPDVMYKRGLYEFSRMSYDPDAEGRAKAYFRMAAEKNHEPALDFLLKNPILGENRYALEKLSAIYEKRAESGDPQHLYDWARLLEFAPPDQMAKSRELLRKAADKGHAAAMFTLGVSRIETDWDGALSLIRSAAGKDCREASLFIANLYAMAEFSDTPEEANGFGIVTMTAGQFDALKAEVRRSGDPKMAIIETARKATGYDEACGLMEAIGANTDAAPSTFKARDAAIECRQNFVRALPSRDACDRAYDRITYAAEPEFDFENNYTLEQRQKIAGMILDCYLLALERGDDYPRDAPFVDFSTALQLAVLYSGESRLPIKADPARELAYLMYGADNGDLFSQLFLANHYKEGKLVEKNHPRACFWYQRAAASHICANFCKESPEANVCVACKSAQAGVDECKTLAGQ